MKRMFLPITLLAGMLCLTPAAIHAAAPEPELLWELDLESSEAKRIIEANPYAKLSKDTDGTAVLTITVPKKQRKINGVFPPGRIEFPILPLEKFRNRRLVFTADVAHSEIGRPRDPWNGLKFMIIRTNQFGTQYTGYEENEFGPRDWFEASLPYRTGPVLHKLELSCGLQDSWGEVRFKNIRIHAGQPISYELPPPDAPEWVSEEIRKTYARFDEWRGSDQVIVFPIITDTHAENRETFRHISYVQSADQTFHFDFIADLGDIGLDSEFTSEPSAAEKFLLRHAGLHQRYSGVLLFCPGNHDRNRTAPREYWTSDSRLGELFNRPNLKRGHQVTLAENGSYGYYDIPTARVRVFFLNTSDGDFSPAEHRVVSSGQMQFFADHLRFADPGWTVIVLTHYCAQPLGNWINYPSTLKNGNLFTGIMEGFVNAQKGEAEGVSWDFTANRDCRLAANITGDSHCDCSGIINQVQYIVCQGYGTIQPSKLLKDTVYTRFDPQEMMNIDIVALKPAKRELKLFRLGAGGAARDRSFVY